MGRFVRGDVVVILFPFSDLSSTKRRPALVIASLPGDDIIPCQITSQAVSNHYAVAITSGNFAEGVLHQDSNVRPERLFTADDHIVAYRAGKLSAVKVQEVMTAIIQIITS